MLYLDPYQQKVDLADNDIFEMVSKRTSAFREQVKTNALGLVIFKFDVKTILDPYFHLD